MNFLEKTHLYCMFVDESAGCDGEEWQVEVWGLLPPR